MSSVYIYLAGGLATTTVILWAIFRLSPTLTAFLGTVVLLAVGFVIFITTRRIQLLTRRPTRRNVVSSNEYCMFVLGSGGHTKEMLMMMDDGFCDFRGLHRRYIISSGDTMSENHLHDYETELELQCQQQGTDPGTFDVRTVTRARRVHQPLWTTPYTALLSALDIFPIILSPPRSTPNAPRLPSRIFSNGPATGFFVGLAVHLLKIFYVVPEDSMKLIYIESWARISTLSVTGKLFRFTGIADMFLVQHDEVAVKYGLQNAGQMVFNARRPDSES